jgi:hypothetical protein
MTHIAWGLDSHGALLLGEWLCSALQSPADVSVKVTCHNNFSSLFIRVRARVQVNSP